LTFFSVEVLNVLAAHNAPHIGDGRINQMYRYLQYPLVATLLGPVLNCMLNVTKRRA